MEKTCKIALVDDHNLFRNGLKGLLNLEPGFEVVLETSNGLDFLQEAQKKSFDVVLLDIDMPKMDGFELTEQLLKMRPEARIITLSMHGEQEYYFRMVSLGVKGFLIKNSDIQEVISAITTVCSGGSFFSQELMQSLVSSLRSSEEQNADQELSTRETEILLLICQGMSNMEISEKLFISKRTVDKHRANILEKTGCKNTANLVVYAIKNNLVKI